jgi:hypothetical protein
VPVAGPTGKADIIELLKMWSNLFDAVTRESTAEATQDGMTLS